jgi:hypothetical protein
MGGAVPLLPLLAFMAWTGRILSQDVSLPSRHAAAFRLAVVHDKSETFAQRFHFLHCEGFKDPTGRVS